MPRCCPLQVDGLIFYDMSHVTRCNVGLAFVLPTPIPACLPCVPYITLCVFYRAGQAANADTTTVKGWAARAAPKVDLEGSRDDDTRRMYDGHDMSSHEVVVRSLLEVLQEFGEAGEGNQAVSARASGIIMVI